VRFDSTGAGTTGAPDLQVGSGAVAFTGRVYTPAVGTLNTPTVDFGIVRVGDALAARNVSVSNTAPATALNDTLRASIATASAGFSASGNVGGIAAGASNAPGTLSVGASTASAGVFNGTAQVAFTSQNPDLSDLALAGSAVNLHLQVNRLANALLGLASGAGALSVNGNVFTLDLGTVLVGSNLLTSALFLDNAVDDPADSLRGGFDLSGVDDFTAAGFLSFVELDPRERLAGLSLAFNPLAAGLFEDSILFDGVSFNASDPNGLALADVTLRIRARVVAEGTVPEPGTLALLAVALLLALANRRRVTLH
jgi:PEP-CTERM motif